MSRAFLARERIPARSHALALQPLLQRSLEIGKLTGRPADFCNLQPDQSIDDAPGSIETGIEIHRAQNRLERIDEESLFLPTSGFLLALSKVQVSSQFKLFCIPDQVRRTDEESLQLGKLSFRKCRILPAQGIADHKSKDRISKKLQLFVVFPGTLLMSMRTVGQSALQQVRIMEVISQHDLKLVQSSYCWHSPPKGCAISRLAIRCA